MEQEAQQTPETVVPQAVLQPVAPLPAVTSAERVLSLQRAAGNRAVATLLARSPVTEDKAEQERLEKAAIVITLEGLGSLELQSVSWAPNNVKTTKTSPRELSLTSETCALTQKIFMAVARGEKFNSATISMRKAADGGFMSEYMRITLTDVYISSFQSNGRGQGETVPLDSWNVAAAKVEVSYTRP
jgi:hypothetical protein